MKKALQNTKNNWLLYSGTIGFILFLSLIFIITDDKDSFSSRENILLNYSLLFFITSSVLIAPILEEISFRGFFTTKKYLVILGSIGFASLIYMYANNYFGWTSLAVFFGLLFWNYRNPSKWINIILIILSSFIFASMHYEINDFRLISTYIGILENFLFSLIAVWLTQNFGLTKSMLFHVCNNSVIVIIVIISVQFPDTAKQTYEDDNMIVTWNRVPGFDSFKSSAIIASDKIVAKNTNVSSFHSDKISKDCIGIPAEPFMKYNFDVKMKNNKEDYFATKEMFYDFLIKKELILLKKIKTK